MIYTIYIVETPLILLTLHIFKFDPIFEALIGRCRNFDGGFLFSRLVDAPMFVKGGNSLDSPSHLAATAKYVK